MDHLTLSQKVGTQFPYDWSNPLSMSEDVFIRCVFEKGLFKDILLTVRYFGLEGTDSIFEMVEETLPRPTLRAYENIKFGIQNAQNQCSA